MTNSCSKLSFWNQLGPAFLLGASASLSFHFSALECSFLLFGLTGMMCIHRWKLKGFYSALLLLTCAAASLFATERMGAWSLMLAASIAISWLLLLWGREISDSLWLEHAEQICSLKESAAASEQQWTLQARALNSAINQWKETARSQEGAKEKALERLEALSKEIGRFQMREKEQQLALEAARAELLQIQSEKALVAEHNDIIVQQESDSDGEVSWRHQYLLLREQFEEKSQILDQTRKELFGIETQQMQAQRDDLERECSLCEEGLQVAMQLKELEDRARALEEETEVLSDLISEILHPKKAPRARKPKESKQESLPLLLQDKIDQSQSSPSARR